MTQEAQTDYNKTGKDVPGDEAPGRQVLLWLEKRAETLLKYGFESELTLRETVESSRLLRETDEGVKQGDVVRGIMLYNTGQEESFDVFVTLLPCDTDEEDAFLLSLSHYQEEDGKRKISGWSFPLTDFSNALSGPEDFPDLITMFKKICAGETFEPARTPEGEQEIPEIFYELPRLQALFESLNGAGAEPEIIRREQGQSFIRVNDGRLWFELSYMSLDEGDTFILRAELFEEAEQDGEGKLLLRFDIPEFGGFLQTADYGRLLETMEVIAFRQRQEGGRE